MGIIEFFQSKRRLDEEQFVAVQIEDLSAAQIEIDRFETSHPQ